MLAGKIMIKCLNDLNFGVQLFIGQLEPTALSQFRVVGLESYNYNNMLIIKCYKKKPFHWVH